MNRRIFLQWVSLGWLVSILQSCFSGSKAGSGATSSGSGTAPTTAPTSAGVSVGSAADLDKAGFVLQEKTSLGPVIVVKDPANASDLKAVNATCTHKGCVVAWKAQEKQFVCPCHNARFGADGSVIQGPAQAPLKTYKAQVENGEVMVSS